MGKDRGQDEPGDVASSGDPRVSGSLSDWAIPGVPREVSDAPSDPTVQSPPRDAAPDVDSDSDYRTDSGSDRGAGGGSGDRVRAKRKRRARVDLSGADDLPSAGPEGELADVVAGIALARDAVALIRGGSISALSNSEKRGVVEALARLRAQLDAGYLHALAELDACPDAVPGASASKVGATFLVHRLKYAPGAAAADVAAAKAVTGPDPRLPGLGAAFAAGEVSRAHVDVAVKCLGRVPAHLLTKTDDAGVSGAARLDAFLTRQSGSRSPVATERLAQEVLHALDPDGQDRYDPDAHTRRSLTYAQDGTGMLVGRFILDPAAGAALLAALEIYLRADTATAAQDGGGQGCLFADERTVVQRRADAVYALCLDALRGWSLTDPARRYATTSTPVARVLIIATPEQVAAARRAIPPPLDEHGHPIPPPPAHAAGPTGAAIPPDTGPPGLASDVVSGPIDPGAFGRLLCDSTEQTVLIDRNRKVLALGRSTRLATGTQRHALIARDRGCIMPDCTVPPAGCQAHHVTWWRHGGRTDIENLALVCGRHHTGIHSGIWQLSIRNGVPWVIPPVWVDPTRTPVRNTLHTAEHHARTLGHHLRTGTQQHLDLDHP